MSNAEDPRLGDIIQPASEEHLLEADVVIFGVPTDEGIIRNGGRPGAAQAPDEIRKYLHKLTPLYAGDHSLTSLSIVDLGNVEGRTLEEIHANARQLTTKLIKTDKTIIALGGGHDVTYPLAAGFLEGYGSHMKLVNVDAHLDVRPKKNGQHHSGSSFRLLIEEGYLLGTNFIEFGIQPFCVSHEHVEWTREQEISILSYDTLDHKAIARFGDLMKSAPQYVTFDIDSVRAADAPGSSAPSPIGFSAYEACQMARLAGKAGVRMFDIVEVSPPHDIDGRTSRLAARMIAYFIAGLTEH
jgi:formiminoglutamase